MYVYVYRQSHQSRKEKSVGFRLFELIDLLWRDYTEIFDKINIIIINNKP